MERRLLEALGDFLFGPSDADWGTSDCGKEKFEKLLKKNELKGQAVGPFVNPPPIWSYLDCTIEDKKSRFHKSPKGAYGRL